MGIRAVACVVADMLLALTNLPTYLDVRKIRRNIYPELQVFDLVEDAAKVLMYGGMDVHWWFHRVREMGGSTGFLYMRRW